MDVSTGTDGYITVSSVAFDAGWHHQIRIELSYDGQRKKDFLLWADSHTSVGQSKTVSLLEEASDICLEDSPFEFLTTEVADYEIVETVEPDSLLPAGFTENTGCNTIGAFISYLAPNQGASSEIRDLQALLACLGYFPQGQPTTAIYGPVTQLAVRQFQEYHGIPITGVVDARTRAELNIFAQTQPEPVIPLDIITNISEVKSAFLIKNASSTTVYYVNNAIERLSFPQDKIYFTYYDDFSTVKVVTDEVLAQIPLTGNVTYRPGVKMVKLRSTPSVYAVEAPNILREIASEQVARDLYGDAWGLLVDDLNDAFFVDYVIGDPITDAQAYRPYVEQLENEGISTVIGDQARKTFVENANCSIIGQFTQDMSTTSTATDQVRALQTLLQCLGYFPEDVQPTAIFGPVTENAIRAFQAYHGITPTGTVGTVTREQLNTYSDISISTPPPVVEEEEEIVEEVVFTENASCTSARVFTVYMELEAEGEEVRDLQELLICLGYFPEGQSATAYYGSVTEQAVIDFQEYHGIDPLGVIGPATRAQLNTY
jgi:peptidoglycan hydrolase-like protein with peptidoglycan-binding domain